MSSRLFCRLPVNQRNRVEHPVAGFPPGRRRNGPCRLAINLLHSLPVNAPTLLLPTLQVFAVADDGRVTGLIAKGHPSRAQSFGAERAILSEFLAGADRVPKIDIHVIQTLPDMSREDYPATRPDSMNSLLRRCAYFNPAGTKKLRNPEWLWLRWLPGRIQSRVIQVIWWTNIS